MKVNQIVPTKLMALDRIDRTVVYQAIIMPFAGLAQILTISILAKQADSYELDEVMQILNYSTVFMFLDLGLLFNTFLHASKALHQENSDKLRVINSVLKYSAVVAFINIGIALPIYHAFSENLGIFLLLNALTIPGLASLALLRGFGNDLKYLLIFNASWPGSLVLAFLVFQSFAPSETSQLIAFIPILSSILLGIVAFVNVLKLRSKLNSDHNIQKSNTANLAWTQLIQFRVTFTLMITTFSLQLDKLSTALFFEKDEGYVGAYLYLGLIATSAISFLNSLGSTALREEISKKLLSIGKNHRLPQISLLLAILFYCVLSIDPLEFLEGKTRNSGLVALFSLAIFLYGPLIHYQIILNSRNMLFKRQIGSLYQILVISVFILLPDSNRNALVLASLHCCGVIANTFVCQIATKRIKP